MAYTTIDDPSAHFQTALYTGNLVNGHSITNDGNSDLQPDLTWIKTRSSSTYNHVWVDSSRGNNLVINSNNANAEANIGVSVVTPSTDGFSLADWSHINYTGVTYAAWQWKANAGSTSSNTSGGITTTVQANTDAGFSIVTYTGDGSTSQTVGHGLGAVPKMIISKERASTSNVPNWRVYHVGIGATKYLQLDTLDAAATFDDWGNTTPTSTVYTIGGSGGYRPTNTSGKTYVAYVFAEKQGYSKFGKYTGAGAGSPFVYTGFKPALVICKRTDSTNDWGIVDSKRETYNGATKTLFADLLNAESSTYTVDLLSNGFRPASNHSIFNQNGGSYIYMAFAENPFVTSTGIPTTAR